jgi:hypothetical protein
VRERGGLQLLPAGLPQRFLNAQRSSLVHHQKNRLRIIVQEMIVQRTHPPLWMTHTVTRRFSFFYSIVAVVVVVVVVENELLKTTTRCTAWFPYPPFFFLACSAAWQNSHRWLLLYATKT